MQPFSIISQITSVATGIRVKPPTVRSQRIVEGSSTYLILAYMEKIQESRTENTPHLFDANDIIRDTGLNKSTVHSALGRLKRFGLVERVDNSRYSKYKLKEI